MELHATMMSIPFKVKIVPILWTRITDTILGKEEGNTCCHRLRIIALFESDYTQAKRVLISWWLIHHLEDNSLLPKMQYGSTPGKQCHGPVLEKVLCHDISRITHQTAAFLEIDAIGCYDHLLNNLLLMILQKLGFPQWHDKMHRLIMGRHDTSHKNGL